MFSHETEALLQKSLPRLPKLVCGRSLKHDIDDLAAMALPVKALAVVDDRHTALALGDLVSRALKGSVHVTLDDPVADMETVEELRLKTMRYDALVAVGSGTISDLCKYVSYQEQKPYIVFPTAASMNGYLSANASISVENYKKTFAAHIPEALFCDLSVIAAAPSRLNKSGLGDSLARPTAQADWLLSHLLLNTPYNKTPFELLKPLEPHLHENARGIAMGDMQSLELLMQTLLLSGLGMTIAGGSYPASEGEHMIAHAYSMLSPPPDRGRIREGVFHGEEIAVTTLFMAQLQEKLLKKPPILHLVDFPKSAIASLFRDKIADETQKAYEAKRKRIVEAKLDSLLHGDKWEMIAARIEPVMIPAIKIHGMLKAAGCPDTPEALGWNAEAYKIAIDYSRFLRDRFTFLDFRPV